MLNRLALIVAETCNLRCSYCYVSPHNIKSASKIMQPELAIEITNHFWDEFEGVANIFFFGGEPLMAFDTIEEVCTHYNNSSSDGCNDVLPTFSLVTNGTLISNKFVDLAREYNIGVTVSLDGPPPIHNSHRKTIQGKGSSKKVMAGIKKLTSANLPFSIECTYTPLHLERGISFLDLYKYFKKIGANGVQIVPQMPQGNEKESRNATFIETIFPDFIDFLFHILEDYTASGIMHYDEMARSLSSYFEPTPLLENHFCYAGIDYFAVNPEGQTFPCHMLNRQNMFRLGNFKEVRTGLRPFPEKGQLDACVRCPIKIHCRSCPARMYLVSGEAQPLQAQCRISIAMVTSTIWYLSRYRSRI